MLTVKTQSKNILLIFLPFAQLFLLKEKPTAEVVPNPYPTLTTGDELRLTCRVNEATVKIIWKRNGGPVSPTAQIDTRLDDQLSTLVIEEVLEDDSAEYSCEAHNTPGVMVRSAVNININAKGKLTLSVG